MTFRIWVVLWILAESFEDNKFVNFDPVRADGGGEVGEVIVDVFDDDFGRLAREDLVEDISVT